MAIMRRLRSQLEDNDFLVANLLGPEGGFSGRDAAVSREDAGADDAVATAAAGENRANEEPDPGRTAAPTWAVLTAVTLVLTVAWIAWIVYERKRPDFFIPKSDYSVFAGLFVLALALERFLEPFSKFLPPDTDKKKAERDRLVAKAERTKRKRDLVAAADSQATLNRWRSARAVLLWGIASSIAMMVAALLGLFLIRSVTEVGQGRPGPNRFIDLVATGLVVGAGTKPLHELTTRLTISKQQAKDPAQTNDSAG